MKTKVYNTLTKPYIVVLVMLLAPLLNLLDRNFSFFFGLGIALLIAWSSNYNWSLFGFATKLNKQTILKAFLYAVAVIVVLTPLDVFLEHFFGDADISSLGELHGNTINYIILLIIVWTIVAFGEELLFKGYYLKWTAELLGNTQRAWIISMIISSVYFAASHYYQGLSGIIGIIPLALAYSYIYYKNRTNLALLVFMHGFHDTIGLTLLYLDLDNPIYTFFENLIH